MFKSMGFVLNVLSKNNYIFYRSGNMGKKELIETLGGADYLIPFSMLFVGASVIAWCLSSAFMGPFDHLSCPLLYRF
jgi:hypothetical protein